MKRLNFVVVIVSLFTAMFCSSCDKEDSDFHNNVYVVGYEDNNNGVPIAKLWKNEVVQNFADGSRSSAINSLYILSNNVYTAGIELTENNGWMAALWKNSEKQYLAGGIWSNASEVYILDDNVYVAGSVIRNIADVNGVARLWNNGKFQDLTDGTYDAVAYSVFVVK